jgi:hypothetical protein
MELINIAATASANRIKLLNRIFMGPLSAIQFWKNWRTTRNSLSDFRVDRQANNRALSPFTASLQHPSSRTDRWHEC